MSMKVALYFLQQHWMDIIGIYCKFAEKLG